MKALLYKEDLMILSPLRKVIMLTLMTFFMSVGTLINVQSATAETLVVNYHRFDEEYAPWSLWLWQYLPNAGDGVNIPFNGTHPVTGSRQLEYELSGTHLEGATEVGVIVRTSDWAKDVAQDLFIDMDQADENGVVEVFLVSGDPTVYYGLDEVDLSHRISQVDFTSLSDISFTATTDNFSEDDFEITADGNPISYRNYEKTGDQVTLTLNEPADLSVQYGMTITFPDFPDLEKTADISFAGLYSSDAFNDAFYYDGALGALYEPDATTFKLWAPVSKDITLNLYDVGHPAGSESFNGVPGSNSKVSVHEMSLGDKGVWEVTVSGDLHGMYYTYDIDQGSITHEDVVDPYAKSTGVNGMRGMVVDFERLNPENWQANTRPDTIENYDDAILYEAHIRDYTTHETWNGTEDYRGKYLGFAESGTTYEGVSTGMDHIVELGITHVHLLPVQDIGMAIDETRIEDADYTGQMDTVFNWGYMTLNFNTVEGSYATDPYDGSVRVEEFKQMVQNYHDVDVRIVLDVVYNHTATSGNSNFEKILPGYYYRFTEDGNFSNGSGTGNETASENAMVRKFIVDSLVFYAEEYNISGFRFDLMKLHDVKTIQAARDALHAIDPSIIVYGEPWDAGGSQLPEDDAAYNANLDQMENIAVFNDDLRDGAKGSVFNANEGGWVQGLNDAETYERIKAGMLGYVAHPEIDGPALPKGTWALDTNQTINYVSAHDNNTLHDKLQLSTEGASLDEIMAMHRQANAIVLTAQGIPFLHGGVELLRTKPCVMMDGIPQGECDSDMRYDHNSYRSPDETNQIDWNWKIENAETYDFYRGLIALRKAAPIFNYTSQELSDVVTYSVFGGGRDMIAYLIYDANPENPWEYTIVAHNNANGESTLDTLNMTWNMVVGQDQAGLDSLQEVSERYTMAPNETVVLYQLRRGSEWPLDTDIAEDTSDETEDTDGGTPWVLTAGAIVAVVAIAGGGISTLVAKKRAQ